MSAFKEKPPEGPVPGTVIAAPPTPRVGGARTADPERDGDRWSESATRRATIRSAGASRSRSLIGRLHRLYEGASHAGFASGSALERLFGAPRLDDQVVVEGHTAGDTPP